MSPCDSPFASRSERIVFPTSTGFRFVIFFGPFWKAILYTKMLQDNEWVLIVKKARQRLNQRGNVRMKSACHENAAMQTSRAR
jgi:hypothetical protein